MASVNLPAKKNPYFFWLCGDPGHTRACYPNAHMANRGKLPQNPYFVWVLAGKVEQLVDGLAFTEQHPSTVQQRHFVEFGMLVELLTVGSDTALLE